MAYQKSRFEFSDDEEDLMDEFDLFENKNSSTTEPSASTTTEQKLIDKSKLQQQAESKFFMNFCCTVLFKLNCDTIFSSSTRNFKQNSHRT